MSCCYSSECKAAVGASLSLSQDTGNKSSKHSPVSRLSGTPITYYRTQLHPYYLSSLERKKSGFLTYHGMVNFLLNSKLSSSYCKFNSSEVWLGWDAEHLSVPLWLVFPLS